MNDIYKDFLLDDFLADDAFIDWALSGTNDDAWTKWLSKNQNHKHTISEARDLVKSLKFKQEHISATTKHDIWHRVEQSTKAKEIKMPSRRRWMAGITAAASLALIAFFWFSQDQTVFNTDDTRPYQEVALPAQSIIQLSPYSKVSYNERNWSEERNISLDGQAHFKVSKGVPFTVETVTGQVRVLGTEFDVQASGDQFMVKVDEGKVKVNSGRHEHILTADMSFYKNPKGQGPEFISNWKTNNITLAFEGQSLEDVIRSLSLVTDKRIDYSKINLNQEYTGKFTNTESLDNILKQVFWPLQIKHEVDGDVIKLI